MFKFLSIVTVGLLATACVSKPVPPASCSSVVKSWAQEKQAAGFLVQPRPLPMGGLIVLASKDFVSFSFLAVAAPSQVGALVKEVAGLPGGSTGKVGECFHEEIGVNYKTIDGFFSQPAQKAEQ